VAVTVLVGNNKYYVTADKGELGTAKTDLIDLTGQQAAEIVAQDLVLKPSEDKDSQPESASNSNYCPIPEKPSVKDPEPVMPTEDVAPVTPPDLSHIDLGSLDEAREAIEGNKTDVSAGAEAGKSAEKPALPPESIFG
jgi:hypothetical protein